MAGNLREVQLGFQRCLQYAHRLEGSLKTAAQRCKSGLVQIASNIRNLQSNIINSFTIRIKQLAINLDHAGTLIEYNDPRRQLQLGYSLVRNESGKIIRSMKQVAPGDQLDLEVGDGRLGVEVKST
jgi:exonuclease VII large subunit